MTSEEATAAGELAVRIALREMTPYVDAWGAPEGPEVPVSVVEPFAAAGLIDDGLPGDVAVEVALALGRSGLSVALLILGLDPSREGNGLRLAAVLAGAGDALVGVGLEYARDRVVFGRPLTKMPLQRNLFAAAAARVDAATALVRRAAVDADDLEVACAVSVAADAAWLAAETALQVHGGYGYTDDYPVARMWREVVAVCAALPRPSYDDAVSLALTGADGPAR